MMKKSHLIILFNKKKIYKLKKILKKQKNSIIRKRKETNIEILKTTKPSN